MYEDMAEEAAIGANRCPSTAACFIGIIEALPRELGAGGAVAGDVTDIKEALDGNEGDLASGSALEGNVSLLGKIEHVVAPYIHRNDPPSTGEGVERRTPDHQPVSAKSLGKQTRL